MIRTTLLLTTTLVGLLTAPLARAENLLLNPGFESGTLLPGWTAVGTVSVTNTIGTFSEGTFGASLSNGAVPGTPATLSQTFTTVVGTSYFVKLDFSNPISLGIP